MKKKISRLLQSLKPYKPEKVILFGSAAKGLDDKNSDLDILIIKKTADSYWERQKKVAKMLSVDCEVDAFVLTPAEVHQAVKKVQPFIYDIVNYGKVIYEA